MLDIDHGIRNITLFGHSKCGPMHDIAVRIAKRDTWRRLWWACIRGSRGRGWGSWPPSPLKNNKNKGVLSNTGPDPLKITKLPSQHWMLGHPRSASDRHLMAFHWRADDGPLIVVFGSSLPSVNVGPSLTKLKIHFSRMDPDKITFHKIE